MDRTAPPAPTAPEGAETAVSEPITDISKKSRNYCFTLNNYQPTDAKTILGWKDTKYIVMGEEVGESGTPHLQGYVEFKEGKPVQPTLKRLDPRIHWETRRALATSAAAYCKKGTQSKTEWSSLGIKGPNYGKGAVVHEFGKISEQGKRSDLKECAEMIVNGEPMREVALHNPAAYVKYHTGFEALRTVLYEHRKTKPTVIWRWGPAGAGKTAGPVEAHPDHYIKDGTIWWNGYTQQQAIIIDDFEIKGLDYRAFLRLLDRYHYLAQYKGGYIPINSPYIYITCDHPPSSFWTGNELAQVIRRIDEIQEVTAKNGRPIAVPVVRKVDGV
nr:putative replication associated protein [Crucivirus sp.]